MSKQPLTLIIFKHPSNPKIPMFNGSYNCGWLCDTSDVPYILQWGNVENQISAKKLMEDTLQKQGERKVIFYDKEININKDKTSIIRLTNEILNDIYENGEVWN